MAKARILAPWVGEENKSAHYHCVSRVVEKRHHFHKAEKEKFVELMRLYEEFCGVNVLSFCVMSNHFHILVEVPPRPKLEEEISDEEILRRVALVQSDESVAILREQFESYAKAELTEKGRASHRALREKYLRRMWDLAGFMKVLKQRFSRWFNKEHKRKGTLWEERYNSSLVEDGYAAMVTAAYIDLNPVRAGMVEDPKDYRWSNYAEAVAGNQLARRGICRVVGKKDTQRESGVPGQSVDIPVSEAEGAIKSYEWRSIAGRYRVFLYEEGSAPGESAQAQEIQGEKRSRRKGFSEEQIEREKNRDGELSMAERLGCRTRAFIDGAVIGSRDFVGGVIAQLNERKYWPNERQTGASRVKSLKTRKVEKSRGGGMKDGGGDCDDELWTLRNLQKE